MPVNKLGKYYIDMKNDVKRIIEPIYKLDKEGVHLYKVPYTDNYRYYPVFIAGFALGNFEMYLDTNEERYKEVFLKQVDWLVDNITIKPNGFGVWEHNFVLPYYDFKVPWIHGMAQGLAISALLRTHQLTDSNIYFETAEKAYGAFEKNIEEGGKNWNVS